MTSDRQAQRFDALEAFENHGVDDLIVLEEAEAVLDAMQFFVGTQDALGVAGTGAIGGDVAEQDEATGHPAAFGDGLVVLADAGAQDIAALVGALVTRSRDFH